ncbi:uncharacterized protein MCYG_02236 [Microsporum canis CBS 113480]|uniref:Uncharacterized protein n=1 Tax=Arthroderma otae (strain ATCC MYA-4605 / CBS 113480) TaxID=554155 RepID=C5FFH0_ARTOC|nr:uncharacterized protein MCYG_02236 [Microsporum canis CBS 113480]EEQ29417.1 predicted protein [Microsporum canis CBS 113480]
MALSVRRRDEIKEASYRVEELRTPFTKSDLVSTVQFYETWGVRGGGFGWSSRWRDEEKQARKQCFNREISAGRLWQILYFENMASKVLLLRISAMGSQRTLSLNQI